MRKAQRLTPEERVPWARCRKGCNGDGSDGVFYTNEIAQCTADQVPSRKGRAIHVAWPLSREALSVHRTSWGATT